MTDLAQSLDTNVQALIRSASAQPSRLPSCRRLFAHAKGGAMTLTSPAEKTTLKVPVDKKYRVIQWGVGNVGTLGLRHFLNNPAYELVGVLCNRPEKVGKSAGELAGFEPG